MVIVNAPGKREIENVLSRRLCLPLFLSETQISGQFWKWCWLCELEYLDADFVQSSGHVAKPLVSCIAQLAGRHVRRLLEQRVYFQPQAQYGMRQI